MKRRNLFVLAALLVVLAWGTAPAQAERLGGSYRGPKDNRSTETDTAEESSSGNEVEGAQDTGGGGTDDGGGGFGEGSGDSGGDTGGSGDEPDSREPDSGSDSGGSGDDLGGGSDSGPVEATGPSGAPTGGGSAIGGGGGPGGPGGKGGVSINKQFQRVIWYFEHNREEFLNEVAAKRNARVPTKHYTPIALFSTMPPDTRQRVPISGDEREAIFNVLKKRAELSDYSVVRDAAVLALGRMRTDAAVDVLLERFKAESHTDVKQDILLALGMTRSERVIETLSKALNQKGMTSYALYGLALTENAEKAGPVILDYFKTHQKNARRKEMIDPLAAACVSLGALRYEKADDELIKAVKNSKLDTTIRVYAVQALGRLGTEKARKQVAASLNKSEQEVERQAALALGESPSVDDLKLLSGKKGVESSDPLVSGFAAMSLANVLRSISPDDWKKYPDEMRDMAMKPAKDQIKSQYANLALALSGAQGDDVRAFVVESLGEATKIDPDTLAGLAMACGVSGLRATEKHLNDIAQATAHDPKARGYAAMALGMLSNDAKKTEDTLRRIIKGAANQQDVRRGALFGLGLVGDRRTVPFLIAELQDKKNDRNTRGAAAIAIGLIRDEGAVATLQRLVENDKSDKLDQAFAVAALGQLADTDAIPAHSRLFARNNFRREFPSLEVLMGNL